MASTFPQLQPPLALAWEGPRTLPIFPALPGHTRKDPFCPGQAVHSPLVPGQLLFWFVAPTPPHPHPAPQPCSVSVSVCVGLGMSQPELLWAVLNFRLRGTGTGGEYKGFEELLRPVRGRGPAPWAFPEVHTQPAHTSSGAHPLPVAPQVRRPTGPHVAKPSPTTSLWTRGGGGSWQRPRGTLKHHMGALDTPDLHVYARVSMLPQIALDSL